MVSWSTAKGCYFHVRTPKAFANVSPGLLQPWVLKQWLSTLKAFAGTTHICQCLRCSNVLARLTQGCSTLGLKAMTFNAESVCWNHAHLPTPSAFQCSRSANPGLLQPWVLKHG